MKTRSRTYSICIASSIALVISTTAVAKKPDTPGGGGHDAAYTIIPFSPPGVISSASRVYGMNNIGAAVGGINTVAGPQAVHLDIPTDTYTLIDGIDAQGVNNLNQIVGWRIDYQAAFWPDPSSAPVDLPPLPDHLWCGATAINDDGIVVGWSDPGPGTAQNGRAVVWRVSVDSDGDIGIEGPIPLLPLSGDTRSQALDLNELVDGNVQVVGVSADEVDEFAVTWTVGLNHDGSLGYPSDAQSIGLPGWSRGLAINNDGTVCGVENSFPFVSSQSGLTLPDGAAWGYAWDINDDEKVVGYMVIDKINRPNISSLSQHAYLWTDGEPIQIEDLIGRTDWVRLHTANKISNTGVIAGVGQLDVDYRGFIAVPN